MANTLSFMIVQMVWSCDNPVEGVLVEWLMVNGYQYLFIFYFFGGEMGRGGGHMKGCFPPNILECFYWHGQIQSLT